VLVQAVSPDLLGCRQILIAERGKFGEGAGKWAEVLGNGRFPLAENLERHLLVGLQFQLAGGL
jgi:hypothetical protein